MATTADCTTARALLDPALPLAHRGNTDAPGHWPARVAALEALRDAYAAQGYSLACAAELAIRTLDDRLEAEAALQQTRAASKRLGLLMVADPGRARRAAALMAEGYTPARALKVIAIADGLYTDAERVAA